ncbi:MAG: autotransporter domain-containing protein [Erythrobacter sp.]|nr:autotransporter domain-containing protein [Erythrobacter sp.]
MQKTRFLTSLSVIGITGGLMAAPASASDTTDFEDEIILEAQGAFQGFRDQSTQISVEIDEMTRTSDFMVRREFVGVPVDPTPEIVVRDDVGLEGSVDVNDTQPSVVQLLFQSNSDGGIFFNCTGTVINPRTVMTAAHCLNDSSSEAYGLPGVADASILITSGVDSFPRFLNYLQTGAGYNEGGVATSTDVVIHPSSNIDDGGLPFPWADIAFVAVDEPITDVPSMPILLSPLQELTHVIQVGYGSFGTAETGAGDIGFLRRVGENMLGAQASSADLFDAIFPGFAPTAINFGSVSQIYQMTDFDNPFRTEEEVNACDFNGFGISCGTETVDGFDAVRAIDWFDGDALENEVGTAPGDSGSPLIADELGGPAVVTAVLSGGFEFFDIGISNTYGDISFYNPLFPFFEFITQNTAYKYVSANAGGGLWSDPTYWTQELDPGFMVLDGDGNLVNGIPVGDEEGVFAKGPKLGTILGQDISGNPEVDATGLPPQGTPNFGADIPESSVLLGPGSTGFVPNNTDGTPGVSFEAPAQYFDVLLVRPGTTTVDIDVEIDKLTVDHADAFFRLRAGQTFSTVIGFEQFNGRSRLNGTFVAPTIAQFGGLIGGSGTIVTDAFFNISGGITPADETRPGTLTIDGNYIQGDLAAYFANARGRSSGIRADLLNITGDASLDGALIVSPRGRIRSGDEFTVLSANSIIGEFAATELVTNSATLFATSRVEGGDVIVTIDARSLEDLFPGFGNFRSLGSSLDTLRADRFAEFAALFDIIDNASVSTLIPTLASLTPISAFGQSTVATNFSQRFTGQIAQRTLALRGGNQAANTFSAAGAGQVANIAQVGGNEVGKLGFFGTVSGQYLVTAEERNTGTNALEESAFMQAGELTLGADLRMSEDLTVGFAMTSIRNSAPTLGFEQRADDTSLSGAVYAALQKGNAFSDVYFGFARQNFGVERASQGEFGFAFNAARGEAQGRQQFGGARVGYAFDIAPGVEMGPVASVDYVRSNLGGFSEFGAGEFGLTVLDRTFTSVGAKAGMMGSLETGVGRKGRLTAFGSVAYAQELADAQDTVVAAFSSARDLPFTVVNELDPNWVSASAGVDLAIGSRFSVGLSAQSDMGRGVLTNNQGRMNINWKF